jgi:spermidine/putrescine ABC transporter ATP-binding subunit
MQTTPTHVSGDRESAAVLPGIAMRGVSKRYGNVFALRSVDLEIADGEFFCLLGPSGSGKTTMLNLIGGFIAPTEGTVWLRGQRIDQMPPHKRPVNTVFQSYALFPHMSVNQNVAFGLRMDRVPKAETERRVAEALALVGLRGFGDRRPQQLSGGQQQRVAVARALIKRPVVLLLDEPLGALDLKLRQRLQVELSQIHREVGTTFVYVTHDQQEAMSMATRMAVMNEGQIIQLGTADDIYRRPQSRFVADFIGDSNFFQANATGKVAFLSDGSRVGCSSGSGAGLLMVRPESIRICEPDAAPSGALFGLVVKTSFLGNCVRVYVDIPSASGVVIVSIQGENLDRLPATDQKVAVWWEADDGVFLDARDEAIS